MKTIQQLRSLYLEESRRKFPSLPEYARVAPKYCERTANGLQKMILDFLRFNGHQAERISVTGRYLDNSRIVTDVAGRMKRIGSGRWIPGSMQPGSADISATINGRSVKIEVKVGRDQQSQAQREYQRQIERAGGVYVITRNFDEFYQWFNTFVKGGHNHELPTISANVNQGIS